MWKRPGNVPAQGIRRCYANPPTTARWENQRHRLKVPMRPAQSLGDTYEEYLDDEWGYAYDAWDIVTQHDVRRHDVLLHADVALLEVQIDTDLDDLQRFAVARAWRRHGNSSEYLRWVLRI